MSAYCFGVTWLLRTSPFRLIVERLARRFFKNCAPTPNYYTAIFTITDWYRGRLTVLYLLKGVLLFMAGLKTMARTLKTRHFLTQLQLKFSN